MATAIKQKYTDEEKQIWKEEQQAAQAQMLEDAVARFMDSDAWSKYVRAGRANLSRFSFNNAMTILAQNPDATNVWGKSQWKKQGITVNEDATPLRYFVPVYGPLFKDGHPVLNDDGKPKRVLKFFRTVEGYDVRDTDAPVDGFEYKSVEGDDLIDYLAPLEGFARSLGYIVVYTNQVDTEIEDGRIFLDKNASANTLVVKLVQTLARIYGDVNAEDYEGKDAQVIVEAATVMALSMVGFDMSAWSVPSLAQATNGDVKAIREYVNTIDDLVKTITTKMGV